MSEQQTGTLLKEYYRGILAKEGPTLAGVDWPNEVNAHLRYALHLRAAQHTGAKSVLDVGCGLGHLLHAIQDHADAGVRKMADAYQGIDGVVEMISHARIMAPEGSFICADACAGVEQAKAADLVVANGLFTVKGSAKDEAMGEFVDSVLERMWEKANVAMSFNLMSDNVDTRYDRLYYVNPGQAIERYTKKFGRHYVVFGDSHLYDTFYVWLKQPDLWK